MTIVCRGLRIDRSGNTRLKKVIVAVSLMVPRRRGDDVVEPWRMRHRPTATYDLVRCRIDDDASGCPIIAPTVGDIGFCNCRHIDRAAIAKGKPVQMAAILRGEPGDKAWAPQWTKAVRGAGGRDAREQRVDEHELS